MPGIGMVIGHLAGLIGNRLGDLLLAIADIDAVKPREGIQKLLPIPILDIDPRCARHDAGGCFAACVLCKMGRGMEKAVAIPLGEFIVQKHDKSY